MAEKVQLTSERLEEIKKELDYYVTVKRPENREKIKEARAQGDLSENAEYDEARDEQGKIEAHIKELEAIIKNHIIIDKDKSNNNLGKTVTIFFEDTEEEESYTIVGSLESDPLAGMISNESPIGKAILKAKVGDKIQIKTDSDDFNIIVKKIK